MSVERDTQPDRNDRNEPIDIILELAVETARADVDVDDRVAELVRDAQQLREGAGDLE